MEIKQTQLLNELRNLFFQQISTVDADFHYETFIDILLSLVKERLDLEEIAYFRYDDCKQQFYLDVTSNAVKDEIQKLFIKISRTCNEYM